MPTSPTTITTNPTTGSDAELIEAIARAIASEAVRRWTAKKQNKDAAGDPGKVPTASESETYARNI